FGLGSKPPGAILAFAIIREDIFFGTLWLAFEKPHKVSEDDLSFLKTLAGNAGMAAANSRLYLNAELGRQRLSGILASTPDPVLVTDHRGNILEINPAASMALGIKVEDAEQYLIDDVIEDPKLIRLLKSTDNMDETAEITLADNKNYLATRSIIRVEGQQVGYVCILRDVTYFKQLDGIKTEFVSTVSHDLRRPLTLMKGYATMLELVGDLNDQQNQYVKKIITGVEGMTVLVSDLLDLGRIEAEVGLRLDNVPVHDVIRRVIQEMRPLADQKQITITMEPSTGTIPLLEADKTLLHQAFKNLLDNAIKYTDRSGSIWVRYYVSNERIIVEFEDTGVGISPVDQKRLFEKFYKSTSLDSRRERGTGLGLAIVKSIADRHGGSVWVDSQLGKGSTFY
ncbi:MAG: PAS domain-containing protein, partial [candidate division Zixibacteria bacterium]|nr:PAS domain-containing protein [candidate division Zixibacteria bacterium]NIS46079.1 PAS domain-containing protein [candidate division Zixibacteria bacterium]NIV06252.1 PAS domain-containing protein [candidate division Zixibacteria bacterium]NIW45030.1 PAS domain-containing protein [Gammaproteobacteria bacterium]